MGPLQRNSSSLKKENDELGYAQAELEQYTAWMEERFYWGTMLMKLREVLLSVEQKHEQDFKATTGIWIEKIVTLLPDDNQSMTAAAALDTPAAAPAAAPTPGSRRKGGAVKASSTVISNIVLYCRGVNRNAVTPDANTKMAFSVAEELRAKTELFDPAGTQLSGTLAVEDTGLTFSFQATLKLKRPIKF